MKIAMIGQKGLYSARGGGIERHVHELGTRLFRAGHHVTVYERSWYATASSPAGLPKVVLPSLHTKHADTASHTLLATLHALFKERVDILHYHGVGPALFSWLPRLLSPHTTVVTTFHCVDRTHAKWGLLARFFLFLGEWMACTFAHKTIVVSRTLEAYVRERYGRAVVYIPNGASSRRFTANPDLSVFGLTPASYILSVTRLIPHKGTLELVRAWRALSKNARQGKTLVIVGDGSYTNDYVATLKHEAQDDDGIRFLGAQSHDALEALYANAFAFVHLSRSEGMPLAVLEAMGAGLPVLLSDIPEHRELQAEPSSLVSLHQENALLLALARLLQSPAEKLREAGEKNAERIRRAYAWENITKETDAVYRMAQSVNTKISSLVSKSTS